jgi:hypothetical protein
MDNLASTYNDLSRHKEAAELQELVLRSRTDSLGDTHPATMQAKDRLARTYRAAGREEEAAKFENSAKSFLQLKIETLDLGSMSPLDSPFTPSYLRMENLEVTHLVQ